MPRVVTKLKEQSNELEKFYRDLNKESWDAFTMTSPDLLAKVERLKTAVKDCKSYVGSAAGMVNKSKAADRQARNSAVIEWWQMQLGICTVAATCPWYSLVA